jgi:hypothetical protein
MIRLRHVNTPTHREANAAGLTFMMIVGDDDALNARDPPVHGPVTRNY